MHLSLAATVDVCTDVRPGNSLSIRASFIMQLLVMNLDKGGWNYSSDHLGKHADHKKVDDHVIHITAT